MKRLLLLISLFTATTSAQQPSAATLTLGLFSTHVIHSLVVTPLDASAWQQACPTCPRIALPAPLNLKHIDHPMHLGGSLRIQPGGAISPVEAAGLYTITAASDSLHITLQLPSERYVAAVLSAEAAPDEPTASVEALAIAARTFALANLHRHKADGYDLCDNTHCQALRLGATRPAIAQAVRNTAGITLWSSTHRASIYYAQHCGGIAENASDLWPRERAPYLNAHADPYCLRRSLAVWRSDISLADLVHIASEQHWDLPTPITGIRISQHTASGRAKLLEISGPARTATISATSLRFGINRSLGWNRIRSDLYNVMLAGSMLQFTGRGYGHGVGLCQFGALQMALEHHSAAEILAFYFPTTHLGLTPSSGVWHTENTGNFTLRTVTPNLELTRAAQVAWQKALTALPSTGENPHPTLTLAPTTELFRQLSSSPGYLLAVTRGNQITLQPLPVIKQNGPLEPLLLHEFLHILIESQSTDQASLWLREGLAEALANIHSAYIPPTHSLTAIEETLKGPSSLAASQQAHRDASAIVRTLGQTYSIAIMRQWLHYGVPPAVLKTLP